MHGSLEGVQVNNYKGPGGRISYTDLEKMIKSAMGRVHAGSDSLEVKYFGTHSVCCGADLAMYLKDTSVVGIMLKWR